MRAEASQPFSGESFLIGDGARGREALAGSADYRPTPGRIRAWRFGQEQALDIGLPFLPHAFAAHPRHAHRVITFEKWGRYLAEVDLKAMAVVRVTEAAPGRRFFGHGAHSGEYIYATQMDDVRGRGLVAVLEAASHKRVAEYPTRGVYPHDCQWLPGTNTLLIVNSRRSRVTDEGHGNDSSLIWMDAGTGEIRKQVFIETPEFGYAHFARSNDGHVVLAGSYDLRKGGSRPLLAVIRPDDSVQALRQADVTRRGEALSVYLDEADSEAVVTLPGASRIQVWNYQSGKLLNEYELGEARGLAYSSERRQLLVSSARSRGFLALAGDLQPVNISPIATGLGGTGSHLLRLQI